MSRLILLVIFAVWLSAASAPPEATWSPDIGVGVFAGGYALLVLAVATWARLLRRSMHHVGVHRHLKRFNRGVEAARVLIPAWMAFAIYGPIGWASIVIEGLSPALLIDLTPDGRLQTPLALPALLVGTLPAMLAWMGLWWATFPADRALREQSVLEQLEQDLPVHTPPRFWPYFLSNLRMQVLFLLLPVLLILAMRDAVLIGVRAGGFSIGSLGYLEDLILLPAAGLVFLLAPEILRRVLQTRPLPDSPLRTRLEAICVKMGLRYREILLWHTDYNMGNAAVMGVVPRMRYILLSDLLLETLTDQQIEAVFAHEVGHIVHRHMGWYVVFFGILAMGTLGPMRLADLWMAHNGVYDAGVSNETTWAVATMALTLGTTLTVLGYLSRRFERQADVFAARMLETNWGTPDYTAPVEACSRSYVGHYGASVFTGALYRVAAVNNIPVAARSWCHGSIAKRMRYLEELSSDPRRTGDFDRRMTRLYATMVAALLAFGVLAAAGFWGGGPVAEADNRPAAWAM